MVRLSLQCRVSRDARVHSLPLIVSCLVPAKLVTRILKFSSDRRNNRFTRNHFARMFGRTSILMLNGKEWKTNRDIIQRAYHSSQIPPMQESLLKASLRVESSLKTVVGEGLLRVDAVGLSRMVALDVFGISSLGYDFGCTKGGQFRQSRVFRQLGFMQSELTRRCFHERLSPSAQFYWLPTRANRKLARHNRELRAIILEVIQKRKQELTEEDRSKDRSQDLLSSVLRGSRNFREFSDDFLSDWLVTSIFGGYDTTSLATFYTLFMLAKYPTYQHACAEEVRRVLGTETTQIPSLDFDSSECLPLLFACFSEALRFYPPTVNLARSLHKALSLEIDGRSVTLPEGARCVFSLYWIHHSDTNFPRPDDYLPERWAQKRSDSTWEKRTIDNDLKQIVAIGDRSANIAFSAGARNCVGVPLASRMVPTILAVLLRSFEFGLEDSDGELKLERFGGSQVPTGEIPIHVRKRKR